MKLLRYIHALIVTVVFVTPASAAPKPNLVVILADDLGYGDLGCFGHPTIRTPNLDKLAAGGLRLTCFYSASPVCSPSRAGLLTGRNPYRLGIRDWIKADSDVHLAANEVTIARLLKRAGYRTGIAGKWHLAGRLDGTQPTPGDHGFDHWFVTQNNAGFSHANPVNFVRNGSKVGPLTGHSSTLIVDEAIRFLDGLQGDPFALFVMFHAPHEPISTPPEFSQRYRDVDDPTRRDYYGSVMLLDHEVGRLLQSLDDRGLRTDTLIVFTSDNGPETLQRYRGAGRSHGSPGPLRGMKLHLHEGGYRVPGIVSWAGRIRPGTVSDVPVCGLDLLPTVCAITGVPPTPDRPLDGASFAPIFEGKSIERRVPLFWRYDLAIGGPWKLALRQGDWKLLADADQTRFSLYNLRDDLAESRDLANAEPGRLRRLKEAMSERVREIP